VCVPLDPLPQDELSCLCTRGNANASAAFADDLGALEGAASMGQTCDTDWDCTNGYLSCNGNKVCGCWHEQGAALDEHGMCPWTSTWQAKTHFVLACMVFIMSILVLAYHTYATWLVLHMGANGAVRKFAFCLEVAVLGWTAINALLVVWYSDPSLLGARTTETVNTIIWFLWAVAGFTGFVLAAMCQGLLWIEFVMASTRVASVSFRLKRVRRFLNLSMISYVVLVTLLIVLTLRGFQSAYFLAVALNSFIGISAGVLFLYSSHKMAKLFARMSSSIKALIIRTSVNASRPSDDFDTSEGTGGRVIRAQLEDVAHMERQLVDLHEKEMRIVRSGRQGAAGLICTFACLIITTVLRELMANQLILWVFLLGFDVGFALAIHAMSSYCIFSLRTTLHELDALQFDETVMEVVCLSV